MSETSMLVITLNAPIGSPLREIRMATLPSVAADSAGGAGRSFSELTIDEQRELIRDQLDAAASANTANADDPVLGGEPSPP